MSATIDPSSTTKIVPMQDRALRTRAALLAAVEQIVADAGADGLTTTGLARATGVSVGTIYRYFADRNELLLTAYDATVSRIVALCAARLESFDETLPIAEAAGRLLSLYLETAQSVPAHAGLLKAMRAIRPIETDQSGNNEVTIVGGLLQPFLEFYGAGDRIDPARLHFLSVLLGTLVDFYLMTPDIDDRVRLKGEIEAHMLLALSRALPPG